MAENIKFTIEHLSKSFERKEVLRDIDFTFEKGKFTGFWDETVQVRRRFLTV